MPPRDPPSAEDIAGRLDDVRLADLDALSRRLRAARRLSGQDRRRALGELSRDVRASTDWVEHRRQTAPSFTYPPELPISARSGEIAQALARAPVVIVCGETGSGKSTQLPKICLQAGFGARGMIGHTQPRRLAARAIAARVAEELGGPLGEAVGYKIRFGDHAGPDCRIKVMTDGILLAEIQRDRWLSRYDALIIDEAHERSLNVDFLLGYLKRIRSRRPDLRVVITSATIDTERFAAHFDDAPVIEVSGRSYPVEDRYRPLDAGEETLSQADGIVDAVAELAGGDEGSGDILVFLAGERDIREAAEALRKRHPEKVEILPLFARLSAAAQDRVFHPSSRRRVVLATNIAETSLTVPRIRYVVDPGLARISRYSYRSKIQRLMIEPVSKASANQRRGRCGRQRDGVCIRLYSEEEFEARPDYTDPEIRRTNLASVILQMECSGLGRIDDFPFIDSPDARFISDGYRLLNELGAVDGDGRVTRLGRRIAKFPLDPRLGRILIAGADGGCLREILPIVALLSIQDPRERPADARDKADECHRQWQVEGSDLLGVVALWERYLDRRKHLSVNKQKAWCRDNFLSFVRMREWHAVHQQLLGQVKDQGRRPNREPASRESVHRAFLSGMLGHIGVRDDRDYSGARGARFAISPGSVLHGAGARWVAAASLIHTSRVFAHMVAQVEPRWIEEAAARLVKREYGDAEWDGKRGHVTARERVSLYGLILAANRPVDFGRVDPVAARELFLRDALAGDRLGVEAPFAEHNRRLLASVEDLEARLRRRDLVADPRSLASFFAERVPESVRDRRGFQRWRREAEKSDPELLFMSLDHVLAGDAPGLDADAYPDVVVVEGNELPLAYRFDPGDAADGVTVIVPRTLLPMLDPDSLQWLVPGYLEAKVTALIRALPKTLRRRLVPAPEVAGRCLDRLDRGIGLHATLAAALTREAGVPVAPDVWTDARLPAYLSFNIRVLDADGEVLAEGRGLTELQRRFGSSGPVVLPARGRRFRDMTDWELGELPRTVSVDEGGLERHLFPALHDDVDSVSLAHYASREEADREHREGTLRLLRLRCRQAAAYLLREFRKSRVGPSLAGLGHGGDDPLEDLLRLAFLETFLPEGSAAILSRPDFEARLEEGRSRVVATGTALRGLVEEIMGDWRSHRSAVQECLGRRGAVKDLDDLAWQLDRLVFPGWLRVTPSRWLREFPRYLQAIGTRLDKLRARDGRASRMAALLAPHQERLRSWEASGGTLADPEIESYRWMLEEYCVSLFDQRLGTSVKVSPERLARQWGQLGPSGAADRR